MTKTIYQEFDRAFLDVRTYAIVYKGLDAGILCIKYPKDGAGRVRAFIQLWGYEMQKGIASGYGYDKTDSAVKAATNTLQAFLKSRGAFDQLANGALFLDFAGIDTSNQGRGNWKDCFEQCGFKVFRGN